MTTSALPTRLKALRTMLRPIVRFALAGSHTFQEFVEVLKNVFIDVAVEEMSKSTKKINVSRISVMTGVHRTDVFRLYKMADNTKEPMNQLQIILALWENDREFSSSDGRPKVLNISGPDAAFTRLVGKVSKSIAPGTVLFELERRGFVERTARGVKRAGKVDFYSAENEPEMYEFLSLDVANLVTAVEENIRTPGRDKAQGVTPNLHITTEYDNLFLKDMPEVKRWLWEEGKAFHKRAREFLSTMDKDVAEGRVDEPAGGRAILSAFSLTQTPIPDSIVHKSIKK